MNRRAFGLVQLFAIFILLLAAIVFVVVAVVNYKSNEPLAPEAAADLKNVPATIFLHNLLITPVDAAPASVAAVVAQPTIGDLIVRDENVSDAISAIMQQVTRGTGGGFAWTVRINGVPVNLGEEIRYEGIRLRYSENVREASTVLSTDSGEKSITLKYCTM